MDSGTVYSYTLGELRDGEKHCFHLPARKPLSQVTNKLNLSQSNTCNFCRTKTRHINPQGAQATLGEICPHMNFSPCHTLYFVFMLYLTLKIK